MRDTKSLTCTFDIAAKANPEVPDLSHVALTASKFENPEVSGCGIQKFRFLTVT